MHPIQIHKAILEKTGTEKGNTLISIDVIAEVLGADQEELAEGIQILLTLKLLETGILLSAGLYSFYSEATCTGGKDCNACKNCKYCKHCAKNGGSCGVCK